MNKRDGDIYLTKMFLFQIDDVLFI